jgi:23S rRNA U2552 (ribose-2'-O)-methylase RlmE/FtsJ
MYSYKLKCRDYPLPNLNIEYKLYALCFNNEEINKKFNIIKKKYNKHHNRISRNEYLIKKLEGIIYQSKNDLMENVASNSLQNKISIKNAKKNIDKYYSDFSWDKMKLYTNPYEFIFLSSNKFLQNKVNSVAKIEPLSRSFFKMLEISNNYFQQEIKIERGIKSLHLAEGPGGFIEALVYLRKKNINTNIQSQDMYYGITLLDKAYEVPSWKKSGIFMKENLNVNILTGVDGIGDLCNPDNLRYLYQRFKHNKMDIVTGDGGFDFSVDYNLQEYVAFPLILCQFIAGLSCLKNGGKFMCKIFDMNTIITVELLYIIQCYFDEISFFKPKTSRLANSEKYIVCTGFKGISYNDLTKLVSIIKIWNDLDVDNCNFIHNFIKKKTNTGDITSNIINNTTECNNDGINNGNNIKIINYLFLPSMVYGDDEKVITSEKIPNSFFKYINKINTEIIENQKKNINFTINQIELLNAKKINYKWFEEVQKQQLENAIQWCQENGIPY